MFQRAMIASALVAGITVVIYGQSLDEVARREAERRKTITAHGKVYTNDSLRAELPSSPPPPAAPSTSAPPTLTPDERRADTPGKNDDSKSEGFWRTRLAAARDGLARSRTFAEALQSRINALTTDFVNRDDPAQRAVIDTDRRKALAELERVKKDITQYQKSIDDIQEEARKAGIPPGWLR